MPSTSQKGIAHIFIILILLIAGIGLGIYLIQNRTNIFPRAASEPITPKTGFTLAAGTQQIAPGGDFYIKVGASSDYDAANLFTVIINYPSDKADVIGIEPSMSAENTGNGDTFIKKWIEQTVNSNTNQIILSGAVPNPGFKTNPGQTYTMATIRLKSRINSGDITFTVNPESAIYRNSDNQNIISKNIGITVKIGAVSSPSITPNTDTDGDGFFDTEELFYGTDPKKACGVDAWPVDVNNDGYINGGDVSLLVPYINGEKAYSKRYDLNRDGKIDQVGDVPVIQKFFLKACITPSAVPSIAPTPTAIPSATPIPPVVDGKRADLYKDPNKPNLVNDQDVSVFFTKCAADGLEYFGKDASIQPICDILQDGKITVQDWAVLIKFRNQKV